MQKYGYKKHKSQDTGFFKTKKFLLWKQKQQEIQDHLLRGSDITAKLNASALIQILEGMIDFQIGGETNLICQFDYECRTDPNFKERFFEKIRDFINEQTPSKKLSKKERKAKKHERQDPYGFYRSVEWRKLRYETLKRYGKKCMCCGDVEGPFNVDHIKPVKRHWELRLDPENMQVLCGLCNQGKGNWDETDFRS